MRKTLEARGQDFDALVDQKVRNAEANGISLTRDGAVYEVVADASEMMLKDTKALQQLAQQNKSLAEKVKTFVKDLLAKIRKALGKVGAQHPEAKALMEAEQYVAGLQEAWDAALVEAMETVKTGETSETGETWNGIPVVNKFELREPVEKKGNLVATHAVSTQNLMRMLDEGTMVGISVAVSKIGKSSNIMFGDNTLVFYASAIDPEANPDNHIFGSDAWTPRRTAKEVYVRNESTIQQARETYVKTLQDSGIDAGIVESLESFFDNHVEAKSKDWIDTKNGMRNVFFDSPPSIGVYNPGIAALYALDVGLTAEDINEAYHQNARGLVEAIRSNPEAQKGLEQLASKITSDFYENRLFEPGITDANERADSTLFDITVANTPDNALAIMKQKPLTDQGDSTGANGIRRKIPLVYNNLNEVHNDQARLTDDVNAIAESVIDTETALEKFKEEISFGRQSTGKIEGILQNAAANNQSISNTVRALWKAGYIKANKKNVGEVMETIQSFRNGPTDYFEAKLMRKSSFSEVAAAVVRESSTDLISRLKENGIRVLTYDGTLNDRIAKVNSVNEAKFSPRENGKLTQKQYESLVENEIYLLSGVREDGVFYRVTGNDADAGYLRDGSIRKSVNHATGQEEDGVSVWEYPKYADKHTHKVSGEVVGIGADGEPLLDPSTVRLVSEDVQNLSEKRKEGRELFKERYNWTDAQIDQALNGGYQIDRVRYSPRTETEADLTRQYLESMEITDSMNESEKWLLGKYQRTQQEIAEKEAQIAEQDELKAKATTNDERTKAENRARILRDQVKRLRNAMRTMERSSGFGGLMRRSEDVVKRLMQYSDMTQATDLSDQLNADLTSLNSQLESAVKTIQSTEGAQRAALAKGMLNEQSLTQAGKNVRATFGTRMSGKDISNRLALAYAELYADEGEQGAKNFARVMRDLAEDVLRRSNRRYQSATLDDLRENLQGSISLTDAQKQELKNAGISQSECGRRWRKLQALP